jgi:hypothetical protein
MVRAAQLDTSLYEEVERDTTQTNNALTIVAIAAVAGGVAGAIAQIVAGRPGAAVIGLIGGIVGAVVLWGLATGLIYLIGTRLFGGTATWGEVLRTVGFANSPGVLNVLGFIPVLGGIIQFAVGIWVIVTSVVAIRQALDVSTGKAIVVGIIGWLCAAIVVAIVASILALPFVLAGAMTGP